ncbi:MAG TPA: methyltransferase domain-containing protein, partial [Dissulfurispiraceae bacterium]|nr:methyltransferase domain-containing protein [Dissulfurispiraceae bacterium]
SFYNEETLRLAYDEKAYILNEVWHPGTYHRVLRSMMSPGMSVLDLGCGSGHAFDNLRACGVKYTGVDCCTAQIMRNRARKVARAAEDGAFLASSLYDVALPDASFDVVFSLYVIEHLVWPQKFLREMVRLTRPGGMLVIICPSFRNAGRMPSLPHGGPGSLKEKLRRADFGGVIRHMYYRLYWPCMISHRFPAARHPWLINLTPACLDESWATDNDAVYMVDRAECIEELSGLGAEDVTERVLDAVAERPEHDESVCFIAAKKRTGGDE